MNSVYDRRGETASEAHERLTDEEDIKLQIARAARKKNLEVATGLREMADFIGSHDALPELGSVTAHNWFYGGESIRKFKEAIKSLGSCKKSYDDHYVNAFVEFSGGVKLNYSIDRDKVCKRITTWDCGDASLLKELGLEAPEA